jgi:hypothetical protein
LEIVAIENKLGVATSMKDFKARGEALGRHNDVKPFFSEKIAQDF